MGGISQSAFETLRKLYSEGKVKTFAGEAARSRSTKEEFMKAAQDVGEMPVPSWEWYMNFETEIIPIYRVELAKTDRSSCQKKCDDTTIEKGAIRIGWMDRQSGAYAYVFLLPWWPAQRERERERDGRGTPASCLRLREARYRWMDER